MTAVLILHISNGDCAADLLEQSALPGQVLAWNDVVYDGIREPGWPSEAGLKQRARFLEELTDGGRSRGEILVQLREQYDGLKAAFHAGHVVLWFDACLFDLAVLAHVLTCLRHLGVETADLICVASYPGIELFDGLGQLTPEQLAPLYDQRQAVTSEQFDFAELVDRAFAQQDLDALKDLSELDDAPLRRIPAAAERWLVEQPDPETGLGRLEELVLEAIRDGHEMPSKIFAAVAAADIHPQYWGDTTLWAKINGLADREPPLVKIDGPSPRLPQWGRFDSDSYRVRSA